MPISNRERLHLNACILLGTRHLLSVVPQRHDCSLVRNKEQNERVHLYLLLQDFHNKDFKSLKPSGYT
jgi:hypothetical protein